jgi:hypothetical protein
MHLEHTESRDLRSEEEEWQQNEGHAQLPGMYQKSYVLLYRACSLYVLIDCILYIVQCHIQPLGLLLCGYYACEYLRVFGKFSVSYKQLKNSKD